MSIDAYNNSISIINNNLKKYKIESIRNIKSDNNLDELIDILSNNNNVTSLCKCNSINAIETCYENGIKKLDVEYIYIDENTNNKHTLLQTIVTSDYKLEPFIIVENDSYKTTSKNEFNKDESINYIDTEKTLEINSCKIHVIYKTISITSYKNIIKNILLSEKYNQEYDDKTSQLYKLCKYCSGDIEILYRKNYNKKILPVYVRFSDKRISSLTSRKYAETIVNSINTDLESLLNSSNNLISEYINSNNKVNKKIKL